MAVDKLRAEWFWCDRWATSSAFLLPVADRGLYREMLTAAWARGASLPNDHTAIQRAAGISPAEWRRHWPAIEKYWRVEDDRLVNDTQVEIFREAQQAQQRASDRGRKGAQASAQARAQALAQASHKDQPPSLSQVQIQEPPKPPSGEGGRPFTRKELAKAEDELRQYRASQPPYVYSAQRVVDVEYPEYRRCPHEPQHDDEAVCVAVLAAARRVQIDRAVAAVAS